MATRNIDGDRLDEVLSELDRLHRTATELMIAIDEYLQSWPSARLAHARPSYLIHAIEREKEALIATVERQSVLAAQKAADAEQREYTQFERDMAEIRKARGLTDGTTPADYRRLREENAAKHRPQSPEDLARVMKEAK